MTFKAIIFDYIGTLVSCRSYTMEASRQKLHLALMAEGFDVPQDKFLASYMMAHEKYRKVRYEQYKEVTNAVWVSEALCNLGFKVAVDDYRIKIALNVFFKDFIDTLELREGAKKLIRQAKRRCKLGLISNFTYSPVIYKSLRQQRLDKAFEAVVVSEEVGWRKPSSHIFQIGLNRLQIKADEAIFIGDSPIEDINGAKQAGLKTVFVPSQFNTLKDLANSKAEPDYLAKDIETIVQNLFQILDTKSKQLGE